MSALASTQVIMCVHRQQPMSKHNYYKVCLAYMSTCTHIPSLPSTLACVYFYVCTCLSSTKALCSILNISCHNSHHLYWHVYTCHHHLQPKSTSFVYKLYVYAHSHQSQIIYGHLRTCQHLCLRPFN